MSILSKYGATYTAKSTNKDDIISEIIDGNRDIIREKVQFVKDTYETRRREGTDVYVPINVGTMGLVYCDLYINESDDINDVVSRLLDDLKTELNTVSPVQGGTTSKEYDPSLMYIPRSMRREWSPIGMMGKLYVRDDGGCEIGGKCDCAGGIAIPGNKWYVMERSDANIIRILYR